ncbi:amylosucrase [Austwickia chelonae]|uniref:Glycosyl hydrolase family 13 catalytic domain-containing protein n=1 Tax=Austwickia chelonae NBRC 105200 TaxID=1184607 RepID=K6UKN0_9MICO|nr:alpha-amylase family protein [Austwickia chelonae]GAB76521.1 hypothetical protein AUCHE_01_00830 [Austwickia chelonae NBRC 105200]SEW26124.1 amylosucrase [Austwickia chelonae]
MSAQRPDDDALYQARRRRWWPDVVAGLRDVYGDRAESVAERLAVLAAEAHASRSEELRLLDYERLLRPDHVAHQRMVGYAAYTERFAGDLRGVADRIGYLEELGVTYLHLMPLFLPRRGEHDGGYAVADHRTVRPDLGTVDDLRALTDRLRRHRIGLVLDLVLNHVADQHDWAMRAKAGEEKYRRYFHIFPDRELPDAYEQDLPEVFPEFSPGNFTWDEQVDGWVWTTFNSFQWDVNWANPDVLCEYADLVFFLANLGVEVLRLDALAFLWKRQGTDCQGQPEVHSITQVLRALARIVCPAVSFQAEAIVSPEKLPAYLGQGRWTGKVSNLAYHNSLMVQIWSALATKDARLAARALAATPPMPEGAVWVTYLRCHDDIGWAIDDADAVRVGWHGPTHRTFLSDWFSGEFPGSRARGVVFQHHPQSGDRRICGTAASLIGLQAAEEDGDVQAAVQDLAALRLAHAVIYGWGGVPVIWSGDELALLNDPHWAQEDGHDGDRRWIHRPRVTGAKIAYRHDRTTSEGIAFTDLAALARVRRSLPQLHAGVPAAVDELYDPGVLPVRRSHPVGTMLQLYNVTPDWRFHPGSRLSALGLTRCVDALTGQEVRPGSDGRVWLPPFAVWWLVPQGDT